MANDLVGRSIEVLGVHCRVLVHPVPHDRAHPYDEPAIPGACPHCAVVEHPLTQEEVLVWIFGNTGDATISRADPKHSEHMEAWIRLTAKGGVYSLQPQRGE